MSFAWQALTGSDFICTHMLPSPELWLQSRARAYKVSPARLYVWTHVCREDRSRERSSRQLV
jgi:hypothetical protein